jgi:two-component system cell cycle response regulator
MVRESTKGEPMNKKSTTSHEASGSKKREFKVEERTSYLIEEAKPVMSFALFNQEVQTGRKGLCVTRKNPNRIRENFNWKKKDIHIIWLTRNNLDTEHCIDPTNLSRLSIEIINFINESKNGIVLLEGLEYLISQNSYHIILHFIQLLNDKLMLSDCVVAVPLDPLVLTERELHLLERDMKLLEI